MYVSINYDIATLEQRACKVSVSFMQDTAAPNIEKYPVSYLHSMYFRTDYLPSFSNSLATNILMILILVTYVYWGTLKKMCSKVKN